jgi:flagellar biosynthetic protein FlhB
MSDDRTLPATPRRREQARRQGLMPMAALPAWVAMVATALLLLPAWARATLPAAAAMMRQAIGAATLTAGTEPPEIFMLLPVGLLLPTVAVVAACGVVGLAVRFALDGSRWQLSRAAPTLSRVDPLGGLARIFSGATLGALFTSACGLAAMAAAAACASQSLVGVLRDGVLDGHQTPLFLAAQRAVLGLVALAAVVAVSSWGLMRLRFERRIRMTPQEMADEARGMQADPKVKFRLQSRRGKPAR